MGVLGRKVGVVFSEDGLAEIDDPNISHAEVMEAIAEELQSGDKERMADALTALKEL